MTGKHGIHFVCCILLSILSFSILKIILIKKNSWIIIITKMNNNTLLWTIYKMNPPKPNIVRMIPTAKVLWLIICELRTNAHTLRRPNNRTYSKWIIVIFLSFFSFVILSLLPRVGFCWKSDMVCNKHTGLQVHNIMTQLQLFLYEDKKAMWHRYER